MKLRAEITYSSAPDKVERAKGLISIVEKIDGKDKETLLGCVMLLLAIAIEQALTTRLKMLVDFYNLEENPLPKLTYPEKISPEVLLEKSCPLKKKILLTPQLSSIYPARLNSKFDLVEYLFNVVDRRNSLMHFAEKTITFDLNYDSENFENREGTINNSSLPPGYVTVEGNKIILKFDEIIRSNPWNEITLAEARRSVIAVEYYIDRVIGNQEPCEMLIPL